MGPADPLAGRDLAAFVAAVETGSVQGAADALQLTQSAATKRLQALERRIGHRLLHRGAFGVSPTAAGKLLYPEAKQALEALARAEAAVHAEAATPLLRLAASHTIGEFLLPGWLARFRLAAPAVRAQVAVVNSEAVLAALREGDADIGFVEGHDQLHKGLAELTLARDEIVAVVAAEHPWARRRRLTARALADEPFLTRERGSGTRAVALTALAERGIELEPALEAASNESLKRAVLDGGFTLLSRLAVEAEVRAGALRALPLSGVDLHRQLRAVRRVRPAQASGPAQRFWRWLEQSIQT